ncbi:MAG: nickel-responsive transcriptional regulator NikR [Tannerellaceae bacterium]|jgi:CopG family nickel-responsive transcriptional regulator|nr:nickel-responsive transcriptional regulator NikR [Tannerellaceae bacterium]
MSLKRFGVSLEDHLLDSLDQYAGENGFANRSQAIRFLIEKFIAEQKWQCNHIVAGAVIVIYDRNQKDITAKINEVELEYNNVILSASQYLLHKNLCMHITAIKGTAFRLTELADRLTAIKGIRHGKLVMSRAD